MKAKRTDRLASQLLREVSEILQRKLSDPRLQWVTLTRAEVSPNMREAKMYIRTLERGEKEEHTMEALRHAAGFIRRELGQRLAWRVIPEVEFAMDKEAEQTENVLRIITELSNERSTEDGGTED
jgi:ribosome-binding factor A